MRLIVRRIVGDSMRPGLRRGRIVLFWRGSFELGDVLLVRHNGIDKIKRLHQLKNHQIFVLGDNPAASTDSRSFGWLSDTAVVGRLIWPRQPRRSRSR